MRKEYLLLLAPLAIAVVVAVGGGLVMWLWNWLLPPLFGFPEVGFWQAFGLLALSRILFGGMSGGRSSRSSRWRRRRDERRRWMRMSEEERERFRQSVPRETSPLA
jgi:hypothetical protein